MRWCAVALAIAACSAPSQPIEDSGTPDAGAVDAGTAMTAVMSLFESRLGDGGVRLQAFASIGRRALDDGGCKVVGSRPKDADGAWLRVSGNAMGGQPILCTNEDGGYVCRFPSGDEAEVYGATAQPLGPGPILFAVGGGADIGATVASVTPGGTLDATLVGSALHLSCTDDCSTARVVVLGDGLECDLAYAQTLQLPVAPRWYVVVRAVTVQSDDHHGALLIARTGRGVSGP